MTGRRARLVRGSTADYRSHSMQEMIALADRKHDRMIRTVVAGRDRIVR